MTLAELKTAKAATGDGDMIEVLNWASDHPILACVLLFFTVGGLGNIIRAFR